MAVFINNFYSSTQQYSNIQLRRFDEGPQVIKKFIGVNSSSIDTSAIDSFRQGVEITQEKHTIGVFKISAGTPGHIVNPNSYGINDLDIVSTGSYKEIDYFNPIDYIKLQEPGTTLKKVITFPIITSDSNQQENYILNGIIEPLSIRPVISFFSIEFPYESHAVRGGMMLGNSDVRKFSSDQILTVDYSQTQVTQEKFVYASGSLGMLTASFEGGRSYVNKAWFLDASESLLTGSTTEPSAPVPALGTGYVNPDLNFSDPYEEKEYFKRSGITKESHGSDIVAVLSKMTGSTGNYVPPGKKSGTAGFVYDNIGYVGTDSIAFGGMTY